MISIGAAIFTAHTDVRKYDDMIHSEMSSII